MLKIDSNRNFTAPKTGAVKTGGENFASAEGFDAAQGADSEGSSDFATILDNLTAKKTPSPNKETTTAENAKEVKSKFEDKTSQPKEAAVDEKSDKTAATREDQAGAATARYALNEQFAVETETSLPPARSILHIADMERIIASVRTHNFEGNNQVLITLKNSVFDGLQIKLTADSNQRITAELIAANDKVKAQLDARGGELADLLRQRGVKLASLQTSVGAETSRDNGSNQFQNPIISEISGKASVKSPTEINVEESGTSETANSYRI